MGRGVGWPQWSTRCQLVSARGSPPCPRGPYSRGNTLFPTKDRHTHTHTHTHTHVSTPPPLYFSLFSFLALSPSPPTEARACGRGRTHLAAWLRLKCRFFSFFSLPLLFFLFSTLLHCFPKKKKKKKKKGWRTAGAWYETYKKKKKKNLGNYLWNSTTCLLATCHCSVSHPLFPANHSPVPLCSPPWRHGKKGGEYNEDAALNY